MPLRKKDSARALEILNNLKGRITTDEYKSFRNAVDKLIMALENPLFSSLLDVQEYYETLLGCGLEHSTSYGHSSKSSNVRELFIQLWAYIPLYITCLLAYYKTCTGESATANWCTQVCHMAYLCAPTAVLIM
ncbi:hypothetical protein EG68_12597 [Paragonimus skrjabini miyazakii]|uniref:L27-1 domain-containing protein n=1 Tax=Paragonimus skrjabini miyazakii TaxID=59628 RepID=A0A8S9YFB2_9TREM|nr:hypothetical protein EG68_12597 [Paragonimus skrjabini miyazakii]